MTSDEARGDHSTLSVIAEEIKLGRARHGLSQDQLADKIGYSSSLVGMVESCRRLPTLDFLRRCDGALEAGGLLIRLHSLVATATYPSWFRPFAEHEAQAVSLRTFEFAVVPGLLQTHAYTRTLLGTRIGMAGPDIDQRVAARLQRQEILEREEPPLLWVIMDEGVLRRPVGGPEVMRGQLEHLTEMAERPNVVIQVVPADVGAHDGVNGSFVIADFANADSLVYLETALTGMIIERREQVAAVTLTYDCLRSVALPRAASVEVMREVAKAWT